MNSSGNCAIYCYCILYVFRIQLLVFIIAGFLQTDKNKKLEAHSKL